MLVHLLSSWHLSGLLLHFGDCFSKSTALPALYCHPSLIREKPTSIKGKGSVMITNQNQKRNAFNTSLGPPSLRASRLNARQGCEKEEFKYRIFSPDLPSVDLMWWSCFKIGRLSWIHSERADNIFGIPIKRFLVLCRNCRDVMILKGFFFSDALLIFVPNLVIVVTVSVHPQICRILWCESRVEVIFEPNMGLFCLANPFKKQRGELYLKMLEGLSWCFFIFPQTSW